MKKIVSILLIILIISLFLNISVYAEEGSAGGGDIKSLISSMEGASNMASPGGEDSGGIGNVINIIIGVMQVVGTGIALIVITILGIKYLLASPSEKAETKKSILPIIIGCILLCGAVNLVSALVSFTNGSLGSN